MSEEEEERSSLRSSETSTPDYNALFGGEEKRGKFVQKTPFGEVRNVKRFTWLEWVFLVVATVSVLGVLSLTVERIVFFDHSFINISIVNESGNITGWMGREKCTEWTCTNDFIFALVLILNLVFCAFYCYNGLFRERQFEMIGYVVGALVIIIYIIANYFSKGYEHQEIRLIRLVLVSVFGPVNIVLALIIWWRMGLLAFTTVGSNRELNRAFKVRSLFLTIQDFNLQVLANIFILLWTKNGDFTSVAEKVVVPVFLCYMILTMLLGWIAVMYEFKLLSVVWYFTVFPFLGYYIFKFINVIVNWSKYYDLRFTVFYKVHGTQHDPTSFTYVGAALLVAAILGVVVFVLMVALMLAMHCYYFEIGLKEKISPPFQGLHQKLLVRYAKERDGSSPLVE